MYMAFISNIISLLEFVTLMPVNILGGLSQKNTHLKKSYFLSYHLGSKDPIFVKKKIHILHHKFICNICSTRQDLQNKLSEGYIAQS